ncbi:hypothetical protein N7536_001457 [Penicillium majusculum]|uniref:Uncharacterized protein n=1 Tax=Penicillium solitum TaxID=60172 RepID=A0A1V6R447_9EURO|nr:uncharacterized protein PENSOL_c017G04494 [Penicillium solitum]KAJ5705768.1 hypothetical protein N7536_001457 [Penicillium majusculum]OQD96067.1 hypothetical protein PENSOL_c017G04494 [Penicillium solitum]
MLATLKTHADARRYDQAEKIATDFKKELATKGYTAAYTDPIERPPVPDYRKIDADQTISDNEDAAGFNEGMEQWMRKYVAVSNAARQSPSHIQVIYKADDVHKHIVEACSA